MMEKLILGLCGTIVAVVSFVIGNNRNESKARSRIYGRMDEEFGKVVRKDVCDVQHKYTNEKLDSIDKKVDKLLTKNGIR